jgi:hypothetical protein
MRSAPAIVATFLVVLTTIALPVPAKATVNSFIDDNTSRFEPFIETAKENGLVVACNPPANDKVCPNDPVTLGAMVLMLTPAVGSSRPSMERFVTEDGFLGDVAIGSLGNAGIAISCEVDGPCPDRPITRGEMASLISRSFHWSDDVDASRFIDTADSPFEAELVNLVDRGGLLTCDSPLDTRLCPNAGVRRDEAIFALVTVMGLPPEATETGPKQTPLGFADSFDSLSLWDGRTYSYRNQVSLTNAGYDGSGLRVRIPKGSHFGADFRLHVQDAASEELDRLFFRYYLRLDPDWATSSSGKLPGFAGVYGSTGKGGYPSSPRDPGWSARLMFSPARGNDPRVRLGYYVYHLGQETRYGDGVGWNEAGKLQPGEWYCLEGEVEMNTLGLADGALRAWVDGTPALDSSGIEFRRPDESKISIESFWFDVYYGGKQVPDQDLGLTFDEVAVDTHRIGCDTSNRMSPAKGDFNGDGLTDTATWVTCPGGTCLSVESHSNNGDRVKKKIRDTAWFSLESQRLGMSAGDIDGDGEDEIVYRGRCDDSRRCWRVQTDVLAQSAPIENWGDGARFSPATSGFTLGDWNGDGRDDLTYQGRCGDDAHDCWRVHDSTGVGFDPAQDWGKTPGAGIVVSPADLDGDGREDLLYQAPCGDTTCWFAQMSTGDSFTGPHNLGTTTATERDHFESLDFDADGTSDLLAWTSGPPGTRIEVRYLSDGSLTGPTTLVRLERPVDHVLLFRSHDGAPLQALIDTKCGDGSPCRARLFATSTQELADPADYRTVALRRLGLPPIT